MALHAGSVFHAGHRAKKRQQRIQDERITGQVALPDFYTTPWSIMASTTLTNPAMFAPTT